MDLCRERTKVSPVGHERVGESLRECHVHMNQCTADLARLEDRMRTQEMVDGRPRPAAPRRMVMQARAPLGELDQWITQLRDDAQNRGLGNDASPQRISRTAEMRGKWPNCSGAESCPA